MAIETGAAAQMMPGDAGGNFGAQLFLVNQLLSRLRTVTLAKVTAVTNSGGVSPVGFVDVQPLVQQLDGDGNASDMPPLYHLPYFRLQGGANAVILDPQVGDVGMAAFCDRDISKIKSTRGTKSAPGSGSRHSLSDGLYFGGMLNGVPSQYVQFSADGITILSPQKITLSAPEIDISGTEINTSGTFSHTGDMHANSVNIGSSHIHGGVTTGSGNTSTPQ